MYVVFGAVQHWTQSQASCLFIIMTVLYCTVQWYAGLEAGCRAGSAGRAPMGGLAGLVGLLGLAALAALVGLVVLVGW